MGKTIQVFGFPNGVSAEEVKNFLERLTGSGTVYAIKVRQPRNGGPRVFAIVQFTSERLARDIVTLASQRLNYGRSYLKAFEVEQDIVPKPRASLHNIPSLKCTSDAKSLPRSFRFSGALKTSPSRSEPGCGNSTSQCLGARKSIASSFLTRTYGRSICIPSRT
uniref:RRM domain-containing protein n=1 Tax=Brassica oleracea TaxID=3712 RepID=A0A3P6EY71_BRAOL|nr:unnamed protein product [Brassica oleracea]